ncbi:MAG TPA: ABC transporter permease [Prosthecobacter sp.]|nr:ABC transporter permease [Prosthecobacter sp.]
MKFLPIIWSNLKYKKLRTALTVLSILVAFLLFGMLYTIRESLAGGVSVAGADRLVVRHKVSIIQTLPQSYAQRILTVPGVDSVTHQSWFGGIYQDPKNFIATFPVEPEAFLKMYPEFVLSPEELAAWQKTRTGAVVGKDSAARFGWKVGSVVPFTSPIWGEPANESAWNFEIVGIFDAAKKGADTTSLYFRYDFFEEARQRNKGQVGWFVVKVKDPNQAAEIAKKIDEEFANSAYETKAETEGAMAQGFAEQVGDIGTILLGVLSTVFFTILLVAGNTMHQAVKERTVELGVLKAVGFPNGLVLTLVLGESMLIALLGGGLGLGLAKVITSGDNPVPNLLPFFYLPNAALRDGAVVMTALGLAAGVLPALQAMRLRIAESLRRNG